MVSLNRRRYKRKTRNNKKKSEEIPITKGVDKNDGWISERRICTRTMVEWILRKRIAYEIARNLLINTDILVKDISNCTGLSIKEINKIKKSINHLAKN